MTVGFDPAMNCNAFLINSALATILLVSLTGCQLVYKLPTRQGNFIEQDKLDQLEVGMTPEQVRFLLGTPIAADPYDSNRWDYLGYYRAPRAVPKPSASCHCTSVMVSWHAWMGFRPRAPTPSSSTRAPFTGVRAAMKTMSRSPQTVPRPNVIRVAARLPTRARFSFRLGIGPPRGRIGL